MKGIKVGRMDWNKEGWTEERSEGKYERMKERRLKRKQ